MSKFCLDPGHSGTPDPGATGAYSRESDIALAIAGKVHNRLKELGHEVIMTRWGADEPATDDLSSRTNCANFYGSDVFLSIHCNSAAQEEAHGTETWCYRGSDEGNALATIIQDKVIAAVGLTDRGVKESGFYVLRNTNMPAALLETAFISNPDEEKLLNDDSIQDKFAAAIVSALLEYTGNKETTSEESATEEESNVNESAE